MAEPRSAGPTRQETANESRLLAARRASRQGEAQPGPSEADEAAASTRQLRTERATDQAAQQNKEFRQGITQKAGLQIDRQRTEYTPQTQVGNLTISRGKQVTDREEYGAGARGGVGGGGGESLDADLRNLYEQGAFAQGGAAEQKVEGLARQFGLEQQLNRARRMAGQSGNTSGGGDEKNQSGKKGEPIDLEEERAVQEREKEKRMRQMSRKQKTIVQQREKARKESGEDFMRDWGSKLVRVLWGTLWVTFGHSIYIIGIIFYIAGESSFARKWIPTVGEEWFPAKILRMIPKSVLIPVKLAETIAILFVLFWVTLFDLVCIGSCALFLGILISAAT